MGTTQIEVSYGLLESALQLPMNVKIMSVLPTEASDYIIKLVVSGDEVPDAPSCQVIVHSTALRFEFIPEVPK